MSRMILAGLSRKIVMALLGLVVGSSTALAAPADHVLRIFAGPQGGRDACRTGKIVLERTGWVMHDRFVPESSSEDHFSRGPDVGMTRQEIRKRKMPPWTRPSLGVLLDNGMSLCVDLSKADSSKVSYPVTVALEGMRARLHRDGAQRFERMPDLYRGAVRSGETRACCRPPLQQFLDTTRNELCEDVPIEWDSERMANDAFGCEYGVWQAKGSSCDSVTCDSEFRVCCGIAAKPDSCFEHEARDCRDQGGASFPAGVTCADRPSPCEEELKTCCRSNWRPYQVRLHESCREGDKPMPDSGECPKECKNPPCDGDGGPGVWACCVAGQCVPNVGAETCSSQGNTPVAQCTGDHAVDCPAPKPVPVGACCKRGGGCDAPVFEPECIGTFVQGGECPCKGACCDGSGCTEKTQESCQAPLNFRGPGTSCDEGDPCLGQCCMAEGGCDLTTEDGCEKRGAYGGEGTACPVAPETCPDLGACCVTSMDGNKTHCMIATRDICKDESFSDDFTVGASCELFLCALDEPDPCADLMGSWTWPNGATVNLGDQGYADMIGSSDISGGTWECVDGAKPSAVITWNATRSFPCVKLGTSVQVFVETLTLTKDGDFVVLSGENQCGSKVVGAREGGVSPCGTGRIAGSYDADWGNLHCEVGGKGLECAYGGATEKRSKGKWALHLELNYLRNKFVGEWDHLDGRTGPVEFGIKGCDLTSGSFGYWKTKGARVWPVRGRLGK